MMMNIIIFMVIAAVIGSIIKRVQSTSQTKHTPVGSRVRKISSRKNEGRRVYDKEAQIDTQWSLDNEQDLMMTSSDSYTYISESHELSVGNERQLRPRSLMAQEDLESDFGDFDGIERMTFEHSRPTQLIPFQLSEKIPSGKHSVSNKKAGLDLKATPKKYAEAFILAECFGEPRAKKPYRPKMYFKK